MTVPGHAEPRGGQGFTPTRVGEVELSEPLPAIRADGGPGGRRYGMARLLVRWHSEPIALADIPLPGDGVTGDQLAAALWPKVRSAVARCASAAGGPLPAGLSAAGIRLPSSPYLRRRADVIASAPPATVIVCTRNRPVGLAACLDAVDGQDYPDYEIVVVDNAPAAGDVAALVARRRPQAPLRVVNEPRSGLSWARNAGLAAAAGRVVAYLDDDERPDRHWLAEIACAFSLAPGVAGASGLVLPAVLDTPAQCWFEEFGGHSKGRGLLAGIFDAASHARQHPLYPLPPFGVGASIAFDRDALVSIGGFDVALGAGTPARAGEDTAAIGDLMLTGSTFVYWPGAIAWHEHRAQVRQLERQLNGYGSGLTAFYTRALLRHPGEMLALARLAPQALHDLRGHDSVRTATMGPDYPARLRRAQWRGMLAGPGRYLRGRRAHPRARQGVR